VIWLIEDDVTDGFIEDGIEFSGEIIKNVMIDSGIFIADERS
jgi:hypothetical protein